MTAGSDSAAELESRARAAVLRLLGHSPKTRAQLRAALEGKGVPEEIAEAVLDRFAEVGLIDDAKLAADLVRSRHEGRGDVGPALAGELRRRGVDDATAEAALSLVTSDDEASRALELARRKLAGTAGLPREARLRRTVDHLRRRGYSGEAAHRAIARALEEIEASER